MVRLFSAVSAIVQWGAARLRASLIRLLLASSIVLSLLQATVGFVLVPVSRFTIIVLHFVRAAFVTSKYGLLGIPLGLLGFLALSALTNPYMRADLSYAHERASAVEIMDVDRRWLGILPPATFADWSDGSLLPPDHVALQVRAIPPIWKTCMVFLEDREFDGLSGLLGVDPLAIIKAGWQTLTGDRRRGASTLYMQVVRTLNGQSPDRRETVLEILLRKVAELLGANALVSMLADHDSSAAERFVAMHLPLVLGSTRSGFGDPLHGIELASRILFGKPAQSLTPDAQAILAAAVKSPILLAPPSDARGQVLARKRWQRVKARADFCLRSAFGTGSEWISKARTALADLSLPQPAIDPDLAKLLPKDPTAAWQVTINPVRRAMYFARHELTYLPGELERVAGPQWRGRVISVRLSTSPPTNLSFGQQITTRLQRLQATLPNLYLSLGPARTGVPQAKIVVACTDHRGKLQRIYSSHDGLLWSRKAPIGSVAKIVAAVALGRRDEPNTGYCRAPIPGIGSLQTDARSCTDRSAWISARQAFARSDNPAIHWALRHRSNTAAIRDVADALRLPPFGDVPLTTALTFGTLEMTPAELLRLAEAIGSGILGFEHDIPLASGIEDITFMDSSGHITTELVFNDNAISGTEIRRLFTSNVRSFVAGVLRATSDSDGTLRSLSDIRELLAGHLYAKTGTVSVLGTTLALNIAGSFRQNGKPWAFLASVTAPSSRLPIGRQLVASRIAALARSAICTSPTSQSVATNTQ